MTPKTLFVLTALFLIHPSAYSELVDAEDIIQVKSLVTKTVKQDNTKAQRVVAFFNVFEDVAGKFHCPVKLRVVDDVCTDVSTDPGVVCRQPGTTANNTSLQKIKWRARGPSYDDAGTIIEPEFTVTFKNNLEPCKPDNDNGTPGDPTDDFWSGSSIPAGKQVCKLKDNSFFVASTGKSIYVKYDIVGSASALRCDPLDPHFIVRN